MTGPASEKAFVDFGRAIDAGPWELVTTRHRREVFIQALAGLPDVVAVIPSGSLTRGTSVGHIHDIDLIVVYDESAHPEWGATGDSAEAALKHLRAQINERLGSHLTSSAPRNHVVKCQVDLTFGLLDPIIDLIIPEAAPVDVMPALRRGSHLLVPERLNHRWAHVDPEHLIRLVEQRRREWAYADEVVRMIKAWAEEQDLKIPGLAIEVMVLMYMPRPRWFETLSRGEAIARFFEAASAAHISRIIDPAGRSGEIAPGINYRRLRSHLADGARIAREAVNTEERWRTGVDGSGRNPAELWRQLFGRKFPLNLDLRRPVTPPPVPDLARPERSSWESWYGHRSATWESHRDHQDPFTAPWDRFVHRPEGSRNEPGSEPHDRPGFDEGEAMGNPTGARKGPESDRHGPPPGRSEPGPTGGPGREDRRVGPEPAAAGHAAATVTGLDALDDDASTLNDDPVVFG